MFYVFESGFPEGFAKAKPALLTIAFCEREAV
jgi:hypothetical protein